MIKGGELISPVLVDRQELVMFCGGQGWTAGRLIKVLDVGSYHQGTSRCLINLGRCVVCRGLELGLGLFLK